MASLLSSEFKPAKRDSLYFDQFEYCVHFSLFELNAIRRKSHADIDIRIDHRVKYAHWAKTKDWGGEWAKSDANRVIMNEDLIRSNCHDFLDFVNTLKDHKLVISVNHGYLYTNSLEDAASLVELEYINTQRLARAVVTHPRGTISLKESPYRFRTYFRNHLITPEQKEALVSYLRSHSDLRLSPALHRWLGSHTVWCKGSYFIDYHNESDLTMIGLFLYRPFRKTLPIVKSDK